MNNVSKRRNAGMAKKSGPVPKKGLEVVQVDSLAKLTKASLCIPNKPERSLEEKKVVLRRLTGQTRNLNPPSTMKARPNHHGISSSSELEMTLKRVRRPAMWSTHKKWRTD